MSEPRISRRLSSLTSQEIFEIRTWLELGHKPHYIAPLYRLTYWQVYHIGRRCRLGKPAVPGPGRHRRISQDTQDAVAAEIRKGRLYEDIAKEFKLNRHTIIVLRERAGIPRRRAHRKSGPRHRDLAEILQAASD